MQSQHCTDPKSINDEQDEETEQVKRKACYYCCYSAALKVRHPNGIGDGVLDPDTSNGQSNASANGCTKTKMCMSRFVVVEY